MTITTEEAERIAEDAAQALSAASTSRPRYTPGAGGQTLEATAKATLRQISDWHLEALFEAVRALRTLTAERDRLREAFRAEREETLWNAFNIGSIRSDGKWIDCGLSDAEWLVRELGLAPDVSGYDPEEIKRRIPEAAMRAALEGGDNPDQPNEALKALYARGKAMRADAALALGPTP